MAAPLVTAVMPEELLLSRQVLTPNSGRVTVCDRLDLVVTRDQAHMMADAFADLADDLDRAASKPRHPGYASLVMPAAQWVPCPTCRGEGALEDEADDGTPISRGCYGGCIDGQVLRQDTGA